MLIFCYYTIMFEAKLLMEVTCLGGHPLKEGEVTYRLTSCLSKAHFEVATHLNRAGEVWHLFVDSAAFVS